MAKELVFFNPIYDYTVGQVFDQLSDFDNASDITIRLNSGGGEVAAGWALVSRLSEITGKKTVIIDGQAASMAAIWLAFFDEVISNDTSSIMFHKAAYPSFVKVTDEMQAELDNINATFEKKIGKKVAGKEGAEDFMAQLFNKEKRNDISLKPAQAKKLGIVTTVRKLNPTAYHGQQIVAFAEISENSKNNQIHKQMEYTEKDLAQARKEGFDEGRKAEQVRVQAFAAYMEIDPVSALAGINDPSAHVDAAVMAKMQVTAMKALKIKAHSEDNADDTQTDKSDTNKTKEQVEAEAKQKQIDAIMNLNVTL